MVAVASEALVHWDRSQAAAPLRDSAGGIARYTMYEMRGNRFACDDVVCSRHSSRN